MDFVLPDPDCLMGYTVEQLRLILDDRFDDFGSWMRGQTMGFCDGTKYNYDTQAYEFSDCGPHGPVVYAWDLHRYLSGWAVVD